MPQHGYPRALPLLTCTAAGAMGAYARIQHKSPSVQTQHDVMAYEEEVLTIAIEQLQYSKSALDDTSMPTDLPDDEPSEAEALSFN